jgi:hypothetical protein
LQVRRHNPGALSDPFCHSAGVNPIIHHRDSWRAASQSVAAAIKVHREVFSHSRGGF